MKLHSPHRAAWLPRSVIVTIGCVMACHSNADSPAKRPVRLPAVRTVRIADRLPTHTKSAPAQMMSERSSVGEVPQWMVKPQGFLASQKTVRPSFVQSHWLPSTTARASFKKSRQAIERARLEFNARAWVSAENSAWEAIRHAAHGMDQNQLAHPSLPAIERYENARAALVDARDFANCAGAFTPHVAKRLTLAHQNKLLEDEQLQSITAIEAAACYLNFARTQFAEIAAQSMEAAQAMDMLAGIYLGRGEARMLPSESALCLRRAALQGQPQNADWAARLGIQLADVGLLDEAQWALEHSLAIAFDQQPAAALVDVLEQRGDIANASLLAQEISKRFQVDANPTLRIPEITQVSPRQFAAMSPPVQDAVVRNKRTHLSVPGLPKQTPSIAKKPWYGRLPKFW